MSIKETEPVDEAWIVQVAGRVSLALEDVRTGRTRTVSAKGKGSVLRLTDQQRELAEERIHFSEHNPFQNGMLLRKKSDAAKSAQELADDELAGMFDLEDRDFEDVVAGFSEVNVRRLHSLSKERNASFNQVAHLKATIEERWPTATPGKVQTEISEIGAMS